MESSVSEEVKRARLDLRKYTRPRYVAAAIELFLSMVFVLGIQWIAIGFDISAWQDPKFWAKSIAATIGIFLLYRAVINMLFEKTARREKVIEAKEKYNKLVKGKDLDLKEFLAYFNRCTKIRTYVSKIERKILRLENKLKHTYRNWLIERRNRKMDSLKELISDEYVESHIEHIRVKYYVVHYSDFTIDNVDGSNKELMTRANYNKALNKASFSKMGFYMLSCAILALSVPQFEGFSWAEFFTNLIASLFLIVSRVVSALLDADKLYDSTILAAINCKIEILEQYNVWKQDHPSMTQLELEKQKMEDKLRNELKMEYEGKMKAQLESYKQELLEKVSVS